MKPLLLRDGESAERRHWRVNLLRDHFLLFAPAVALELVGWWVHHSPALLEDTGLDGLDLANELTQISTAISLARNETDDLAYLEPILHDLLEGRVPDVPRADKSLLNGPLMDANRCCGLPSCRSRRAKNGGDLLRCSGGCAKLEQYCCKEHQLADWPRHRAFCKSNKS